MARQGEDVLRRELARLDIEQLKDVAAQYGMDPGKLVMKWKDTGRIIHRVVELSLARSTKGDAFRADVASWLQTLGLERYEATFQENAVDAEVLPTLTADDLKEMGVVPIGHRRRLLEAIAALRLGAAADGIAVSVSPAPAVERANASDISCDYEQSALSGNAAAPSRGPTRPKRTPDRWTAAAAMGGKRSFASTD